MIDTLKWAYEEYGAVGVVVRGFEHLREMAFKQLFRHNDVVVRVYEPIARRRAVPNPFRVYWIEPNDVNHLLALPPDAGFERADGKCFDKYRPGAVAGGWDRYVLEISEIPLFEGLRQRFVKDEPWKETILYPTRYDPSQPIRKSTRYTSYSEAEFRKRAVKLERIYESLREDGFLPQSELSDGQFKDELTLAIGRDGRLIRNSAGLHRLILAQLLGLDRIPARVVVVHEDAPPVKELPLRREQS